ncbi:hypothetical protein Droror1_Dr00027495 [Drosera rotundifolia]
MAEMRPDLSHIRAPFSFLLVRPHLSSLPFLLLASAVDLSAASLAAWPASLATQLSLPLCFLLLSSSSFSFAAKISPPSPFSFSPPPSGRTGHRHNSLPLRFLLSPSLRWGNPDCGAT